MNSWWDSCLVPSLGARAGLGLHILMGSENRQSSSPLPQKGVCMEGMKGPGK